MACTWGELSNKSRWKPGQGVSVETGKNLSDHFISVGIKDLAGFVNHVEEVEEEFWGKRFKVYARWKERWWHQYQKIGYVDLLTGFRCSGIMGKNDAINYPIQGAAFHCLLWSFIELDKLLYQTGWRSRIIGQIHDAVVFDVYPPELPMLVNHIKRITTHDLPKAWDWINVPLAVDFEICDVDASWAEKKELKL
jgi:DNA polymerase I-like protein with 3'-5' exonuclease and polymerase domains